MPIIIGACASGQGTDSTPGEISSSSGEGPLGAQGVGPSGAGPLAFGVKSTIQDAAKEVPYELLLPDSDLANASTLSQVWLDEKGQAVGLVYQGDQLTLILQPSTYKDPKAVFEERVASGNAKESVGSVGPDPALLSSPTLIRTARTQPGLSSFAKVST
jgi:hypothetical protein